MLRHRVRAAAESDRELHLLALRHPAVHKQWLAGDPGRWPIQVVGLCPADGDLLDHLRRRQSGQQPLEQRTLPAHVAGQIEPQPATCRSERFQVCHGMLGTLHGKADQNGPRLFEPIGQDPLSLAELVTAIAHVNDEPSPVRLILEGLYRLAQTTVQIRPTQRELLIQTSKRLRQAICVGPLGRQPAFVQGAHGDVGTYQTHTVLRPKAPDHLVHCAAYGLQILDAGRSIRYQQHIDWRRFCRGWKGRDLGQKVHLSFLCLLASLVALLRYRLDDVATQCGWAIRLLGEAQYQVRFRLVVLLVKRQPDGPVLAVLEDQIRM